MAKTVVWILILVGLSACGPAFHADFSEKSGAPSGEAGEAGAAGESAAPEAGAAGLGAAGSGGMSPGAAGASAGGTPSVAGAGTGGAPPVPTEPCAHPVLVTGGVFTVTDATCYRTTADFDTVTCTGWEGRTLKINGAVATCNRQGSHPPAYDGYNYFEISGGIPAVGQLRWFFLNLTVPCRHPKTVSGGSSGKLGTTEAVCLRTLEAFNATDSSGMDDRKLTVNNLQIPGHMQAGFPPTTDAEGYNYIEIGAGSDPLAALTWKLVPLP